ncbi:unnamed protein product [Cladocopium goreaui]|uniref:Uncharacterized protein n=1 Tax=Cladocopium goreaui TaxID=2562237 RepID=A0A9P1BWT7_9DINO|nr:unnamed protein product [Cladocopium goreaui]|mmetsp:Transcript_58226/g.118549  ORF Transcript_58226/g.118549 Transcript_58226/m.118549 type:complete len:654 (+) Transcript_58226:48-2009(+)
MIRSLCWFSVFHGSLALETETRPVTKVVNLLEGMQSNLEKEAKEDEDTHDKMQCWCKTNGDEKTKSIEEAQTKIKALEARMDELTATSSRLATEIAVAEEEVSNNEKALQSAQALREKQFTEFKSDFKDLTESATSVDKALDAIGTNKSSFLQTSRGRMASAMTQLKMVLLRHERLLNDAQRSEVEELLNPRSESEFLQQAPSSIDGVAGVLTGLKDSFEGQLSDLKKQESEDKKAHEGLVKAKTEELQADKKQLEAKKEQKAAADLEKSQSKQDMKDTTAALEADSAVSEEVKAKCAAMDTDYEKRGKLRREEQAAVSQTIQVLTADEARENFGKTFSSSFLQVSSQDSRQTRAAAVLAASGEKLDASALTTLAMSVKLDTFESVKKAIDEMKADLKKQQAAEVKKKDWCVAELQKTKLETQEKSLTEQQKVAELETIQSKTSQLVAEIQSLEDEVAEMNKQTQLAGQNREKENKEFQTVVTEQRQTQLLLQKAMTSLKKFYVKENEAAFIQAKSDDGEPEFKDYKEQSSFGVLSMLQKLIADAKAMEAEATHAETSAQKDYEAFAKTTTAAIKTKLKERTTKEKEKGAAESSLVEARQAKDALGTKLDELVTLKRHLHDQCDILMKRFDERQSARSDEMESLTQAKAMLEA